MEDDLISGPWLFESKHEIEGRGDLCGGSVGWDETKC